MNAPRIRAERLALVNWRGVFYAELELHAHDGVHTVSPVGDATWTGNGQNASYGGMGALAVEFCRWAMPKNSTDMGAKNTSHGCWSQTIYDADASTWTKPADVPSLVIQWSYVGEWITSGVGQGASSGCSLGNPTCIPALRLVE